jgi:hypothetical protein
MRCNAGVPPELLMDQHLIAEYRELFFPFGQLKDLGFKASPISIPEKLKLGTGHIVFWRNKQLYLKRRHEAIVEEMLDRGFNVYYDFWDIDTIPEEYLNDWEPSVEESLIIRERIWERICEKPYFYRFMGNTFKDLTGYKEVLFNAPVLL